MMIEAHGFPSRPRESDAHAEVVKNVLGFLAEAQRADIQAKFRVGDAVHAMRYSPSFRRDAVRMLAASVALEHSGILRIARVAERIRRDERERLLALVNARGLPLTWSHLEALQHVHGTAARLELAQLALRDDLSVRALRLRIRESDQGQRSRTAALNAASSRREKAI